MSRPGRREWVGLAVIALPYLLYSMDLTVLELAVPKLSADLRPTSSELLWIMDIYGFLIAGFLITMGTLGDRIGRRRLLLIDATAFGAASLLVLGPALLPEYRDPAADRLDVFSAALSLITVLTVIYGLKQFAQDGWGWLPLLAIVAGVAVGVAFARRQRTLRDPLIDLRLFRAPAFTTSLATFAFSIFVIAGLFLFIAQYLQLVLGLSPLVAGLWTVPSSGGLIVGSMLAPVLVRRVRPAYVMAGGLALAAAGLGLLTQVTAAWPDGPRRRIGRPHAWRRSGGDAGNRYRREQCPTRAGRSCIGDLRDRRRARRGARHRDPRQHWRGGVPRPGHRCVAGHRSTRHGRDRARHPGRCRRGDREVTQPDRRGAA
jgi:hypothetical protein